MFVPYVHVYMQKCSHTYVSTYCGRGWGAAAAGGRSCVCADSIVVHGDGRPGRRVHRRTGPPVHARRNHGRDAATQSALCPHGRVERPSHNNKRACGPR
jgi:hypothetical protein